MFFGACHLVQSYSKEAKTWQLTSEQSRWINRATDQKKNHAYFCELSLRVCFEARVLQVSIFTLKWSINPLSCVYLTLKSESMFEHESLESY